MKFYRDNLRPDLFPTGGVRVSDACDEDPVDPILDCNRDLHMVTLGVGLGVRGNIFGVTHNTRRDAFELTPDITWQEPNILRNPVQVDDLYHATINGRGELLNATTPDEISTKMQALMQTVLSAVGSSAATATNSTSLKTDSQVFQARFDSRDWSGQLLAFNIDLSGNVDPVPIWDAGEEIKSQSAANRKIISYGTDTRDGIPFTWSAINSEADGLQAALLNADASGTVDSRGSDRVSYLRGDEITGFRTRETKLGDIVNSSPFFIGPPRAGYPDPDYATFTAAKSGRTPMIYVGANDGMLHGFDATRCTVNGSGDDACTGGASPGAEKIAYVPAPVYPYLSRLTDPEYGESSLPHRYYVDGSPMGADVKLGSNWTTVLIGGLNAGGQGYYALDVTNPSAFSEVNAASLVLWEFTDEVDADLGYTFNQPPINPETQQSPQIAKLNNGKWALIVGNGYNNREADGHQSATGHAALFVIFIEDGTDGAWDSGDYVKIDTGAGSDATPNGLATPRPEDIDGDGDVDLAYAGDLEGNLWKFDLTSDDSDDWTARLLFAAVDGDDNPQPITTAPVVVPHPRGGSMVSFGTGKYLETGDPSDISEQTFYGIWDDEPAGDVNTADRSELQMQEVLAVVNVSGIDYRITSNNTVDYTTQRGWYMDLPTTGERVAFNPIARDLRTVFVTLIPNISDPCSWGGTGWLMELDYLTGSRLSVSPFDVNGDYAISDLDLVDFNSGDDDDEGPDQVPPSGAMLGIGIPTTPTVLTKDDDTEVKVISGTSGQIGTLIEGRSVSAGRLSWRQIIGD